MSVSRTFQCIIKCACGWFAKFYIYDNARFEYHKIMFLSVRVCLWVGPIITCTYVRVCLCVEPILACTYVRVCLCVGPNLAGTYVRVCLCVGPILACTYVRVCLCVGPILARTYVRGCLCVGPIRACTYVRVCLCVGPILAGTYVRVWLCVGPILAGTYVHVYLIHKLPGLKKRPHDPILSHFGIAHTQPVPLVYIISPSFSPSTSVSYKWPSCHSLTNSLCIASSIRNIHPAYIITLDCIRLIIAYLVSSMYKALKLSTVTMFLSTGED
jgi:hypothetical protein